MQEWIPYVLIIVFIDGKRVILCRVTFMRNKAAPNLCLLAIVFGKNASFFFAILGFLQLFNEKFNFLEVVLGFLFGQLISVACIDLKLVRLWLLGLFHFIDKHLEFNALVQFKVCKHIIRCIQDSASCCEKAHVFCAYLVFLLIEANKYAHNINKWYFLLLVLRHLVFHRTIGCKFTSWTRDFFLNSSEWSHCFSTLNYLWVQRWFKCLSCLIRINWDRARACRDHL